ncbi:MAG TPA: hypothetical protein VIJ57_07655, partial [Hanamia sp.]
YSKMKISKIPTIIFFLVPLLFSLEAIAQQKTQNGATNSSHVTYIIKKNIIVDKPVSPLLYGTMIELGFGRSDNLCAEMLYNLDFEEDEPISGAGWLEYDRPKSELEDWWHSGYEECKWYLHKNPEDSLSSFTKVSDNYWPASHGKTFISLVNKSGSDNIYFAQDSIYLQKNTGYHFSGLFSNGEYFSADKYSKRSVDVTIGFYPAGDFSHPLEEKTISVNTIQFNSFETDLPAINYQGFATFAIKLAHEKKVSLDLLSLMPADNQKGWRKDVVQLTKNQVGAGIIRFPGGCFASLYNWRDGVGERDQRPVNYKTWWGNVLVNDIGTIEFAEFCRMTKAEPFLCVPVMFGTPENARDWVDFCNSPNNELRKRAGHPKPLQVKYWELDNEPYRKYDAITYAKRCVEFAKMMKKVDPGIKLVMGNYWVFHKKFKEMLDITYPYIDLITNRGGSMEELASDLKVLASFNKMHHTNIRLCHTEFRAPLERAGQGTDGLNKPKEDDKETLFTKAVRWQYGMSVLDQYIQFQNFGGDFAFANFVNYSDGWGENIINIPKEDPFLSSVGKAMELLHKLPVAYPLKIENKNIDPDVELQAAWNKQKNRFTLIILNYAHAKKELHFDLADLGVSFAAKQKLYIVSANKMTDFNSPAHKDAISNKDSEAQISGRNFSINVVPNSATAIVFDVK